MSTPGADDARDARVPQAITYALQHGLILDDHTFDRVYPTEHRFRSWLHWTPLDVAQRACALLAARPGSNILDVGSGIGKVCHVGALTTRAQWFGIERDPEMVRAAEAAAAKLGVEVPTCFIAGEMTSVNWLDFDGFYLFNPFAETLFTSHLDPIDRREHFVANVEFVQQQLAATRAGTRVVTYHGLGGDLPACFELVRREAAHEDELCLWIHRGAGRRARPSDDVTAPSPLR